MVQFGLIESVLALIGGLAGGAFSPWFSARIEKARKRRDLFEPIYNNISNIAENGLYRDNAKKWDTLSASNQLLVSPRVEDKLGKYSEMCSDFQTKYGQLFHARGKFDSVLNDDLYRPGGSQGGPRLRVDPSDHEIRVVSIPLPDMIHRLKLYECNSPQELRARINQDAENRNEDPYSNTVQYLNTNHHSWTSDIHEVLQSEVGRQWISHKQDVQEYAEELKPLLRKSVLSSTDRINRRISGLF
ncbi:hypothetical protein [Halococcus sp. PRR34]|uniref:hypothetical protein n=1 Tax=Halococcus sp. PRR34 TaxID=3020830 RepID=UPI002361FCC0|nr:hypothetical protein [Halococcus sp. PRR34]